MENYDKQFQLLDKATSLDTARQEFTTFLKTEAENLRVHPEDTIQIAYHIAGMLATNSARLIEQANDPIDEILTIAGELEVNPPEASILRDELLAKIDALQ